MSDYHSKRALSTKHPKQLMKMVLHDESIDNAKFRKLAMLAGAKMEDFFEMDHGQKRAIARNKEDLLRHFMSKKKKSLAITRMKVSMEVQAATISMAQVEMTRLTGREAMMI